MPDIKVYGVGNIQLLYGKGNKYVVFHGFTGNRGEREKMAGFKKKI